MLLVQSKNGRFYLPGGRAERSESCETALAREMVEECGWSTRISRKLHEEIQPIFAGRVVLLATYWLVELVAQVHDRPEHRLAWTAPADAARLLHRPGDLAALRSGRWQVR